MPIKNFLVYSAQKRGFLPGIRYANPRYFVDAKEGLAGVIVVGGWPKVTDAYRHGYSDVPLIEVADAEALLELMRAAGEMEAPPEDTAPEPQEAVVPRQSEGPQGTTPTLVTIPADWRENLAWPVLRSLASSVSDTPVKNRAEAEAAIEAELARRAG
jgi:hypothetical protein